MTMLTKLHKQLRQEFPDISPALTKAVIWFVSGGMNHETFEDKCARLLSVSETEFSNKNEEDEFIYDVLLASARNSCRTQELLNHFKLAIQQSTAQVKQKKLAKEQPISGFQSSLSVLTSDRGSPALFDSKKGKRHRELESTDLDKKISKRTTRTNHN